MDNLTVDELNICIMILKRYLPTSKNNLSHAEILISHLYKKLQRQRIELMCTEAQSISDEEIFFLNY